MTDDSEDLKPKYEVGYKKPPAQTRFKPGQSGNAKGRKEKSRDLKTDLYNELYGTIRIREGEREYKVTRQQALIKSLIARAIKGDHRATDKLLVLIARVIGSEGSDGRTAAEISAADKEILASYFQRQLEEKKS
ncbi:MAG: DUF5681 domain-containing protein [bacterium]|nr:DUF5681 domain-containing protein [bacterium]